MREHRQTICDAVARVACWLTLLAGIALLQACSGTSQPFSKSTTPSGRPPPTISTVHMNGMPRDKAKLMSKLLQEAAAKRDIVIVAQDFADSWKLAGDFMPQSQPDGTVTVVYGWTLRDRKGQVLHQISGAEPAGPAGGDPWLAVTPDALRRIAGFTAESLSSRLSQLGYATQIGGLMPPTETYARAGPNAEKEIDYETLYGTQTALAAPPELLPDADAVAEEPQATARQVAAFQDTVQAVPAGKPAAPAGNANTIRAVAVTGVKGASGAGNRELASAMRRVLKQAGWPVYTSPRPDALTISGNVDIGAVSGALQQVALAWTVKSPGGEVLGTIKQANKVKAGSLDAGWGKTADYAAQAGAEGIFNLIKKLQ